MQKNLPFKYFYYYPTLSLNRCKMNNPTEISGFIHNVSPLKFPPSPKVSFPPKPIPQKNNIASLSGVHFQQLITVKAKVTHMGATKTVTTSNAVKPKDAVISLTHQEQ